MNNKIRGLLEAIIIILIIVQPLFDVYMAIIGESLDIFGISVVTLIRTTTCVALVVITGICQIKNRYKIKWLIALIAYLLLVTIYCILHHFNITLSAGYFMAQGLYSAMTELMYVLRLVVPIILIYTVIIVKPDKEQVEKAIISVTFIISLVIILTNLFEISYASYSPSNDLIEYNVFDWFKSGELSYKQTLSKGFFVSANQIGALLVILLPIVIMYILKHNQLFTYFVLFFTIVSMVLIGTRVASFGFILVTTIMLLGIITIKALNGQKINFISMFAVLCITLIGIMLYSKSPAKNRAFLDDEMYSISLEDLSNVEEYIPLKEFKEMLNDEEKLIEYTKNKFERTNDAQNLQYKAMCKYIKENYRYHSITRKYILDIYPYTEDPEFWLALFEEPVSVKGDNRARQSVIIKRIKELNDNKIYDTILGMGATPMNQREYMIENDLISHYYNIGIVGIILFVMPYAVGLVYVLVKVLADKKSRLTARIIAYMAAIAIMYGVGYFAGHVIDEYIITIFVAVISGVAINYVNEIGGKTNERYNA